MMRNNNQTAKILIIGAGPTGLGAAHRLNKLGYRDWLILERNAYVGGLSASFVDNVGFTWDIGGHVLFSHYKYFDNAVDQALGEAYYEHLRESWIRILQTWVPYPFQNNIRHLPPAALEECINGLLFSEGIAHNAPNFLEWMKAVFGSGIVKYFMQPYNEKVWAVPLELMSRDWIGERVNLVDLGRIQQNIVQKKDDVNWGPNNKFKFPKRGGTGAIFNGLAKPFLDRIRFNHCITRIELKERKVAFADGRHESFDILINTGPLDCFVQSCTDAHESVKEASQKLVNNSGLIVCLGFSGKRADSKCWMYFPENNTPFYRVTNYHNYSPYNVPRGEVERFFSFICETSYSSYKEVDKSRIVEETIQGLVNSGMIGINDRDKIVARKVIDLTHSYPVPTIERDRALSLIQPYLESYGVFSRGRFGAWKYEVGNMDHSFMQGVEVVNRILNGDEERTVKGKIGA